MSQVRSLSGPPIFRKCIMLHLVSDFTDKFFSFLTEDPVRPNIPHVDRIGDNKDIFVMRDDDKVQAITCVSYQKMIPTSEAELFEKTNTPVVAVFYTIWSYKPGAGRQLIFDAVAYINEHKTEITRFVTLSPKTEMARRFHLKNGAVVFRENEDTVNYEYLSQSREGVSHQAHNLKVGGSSPPHATKKIW